jgi:hypothetical protein
MRSKFSLIRYFLDKIEQNGGGCGYVEWHDPPLPKFWSDLLGDLRDEVWRMRSSEIVPRPVEDAGTEATVNAVQVQMMEKDAEIVRIKAKYENVVFVLIVFLFGLVVGKMVMQ